MAPVTILQGLGLNSAEAEPTGLHFYVEKEH